MSEPLKIVFINMPFASLGMPSLALTQLEGLMKTRFPGRVDARTHYLNLDFAEYLGDVSYYQHAIIGDGFMTGIGDWYFRQSAFPDAADNEEDYFDRYYFSEDETTLAYRKVYGEKRKTLDAFLDQLIDKYNLAEADVVGFTTLFSQAVGSFAL
ncbi:MAG: RiPP maturation radical SAM protein 1, partial [Verrucomicrobiota bacterium]